MADWIYRGDLNVECGGFWILDEGDDDFVTVAELVPVSDMGGPDNLFILVRGSIYLPLEEDKRKSALDTIGWFDQSNPDPAHYRMCLIDAFRAYHGIEQDVWNGETVIRVGPEAGEWDRAPDVILPEDVKLREWLEAEYGMEGTA